MRHLWKAQRFLYFGVLDITSRRSLLGAHQRQDHPSLAPQNRTGDRMLRNLPANTFVYVCRDAAFYGSLGDLITVRAVPTLAEVTSDQPFVLRSQLSRRGRDTIIRVRMNSITKGRFSISGSAYAAASFHQFNGCHGVCHGGSQGVSHAAAHSECRDEAKKYFAHEISIPFNIGNVRSVL